MGREAKSRDALTEMGKEAKEVTPGKQEGIKRKGQERIKNADDPSVKSTMIKHLSLENDNGQASIEDTAAPRDKGTQDSGCAILLEDEDDDQDVPVLATSDAYMR